MDSDSEPRLRPSAQFTETVPVHRSAASLVGVLHLDDVGGVAQRGQQVVDDAVVVVALSRPGEQDGPDDVVETIEGEYDLRGSYRFAGTYPEALRGIAEGRYDVDGVVSFEASFADTPAAFECADPESVKGVVRVHE